MAFTERYVTASAAGGGSGTTEGTAWTLAEAIAAVTAGVRVNVKAGTYANTTTSRSPAADGTTTAPIWWRGYNSTIGDCDGNPALARPEITFTTGAWSCLADHNIFSSLNFSGQRTGGQVTTGSGAVNNLFYRCRIQNTGSASTSRAADVTGTPVFFECLFKAAATADRVVSQSGGTIGYRGCVFEGGLIGLAGPTGMDIVDNCIFRNLGSHGIELVTSGTAAVRFVGNTFYNVTGDGIRFTQLSGNNTTVMNNVFSVIGGYGINNATGTDTGQVRRFCNLFHSCTSGTEFGFGDSPAIGHQTDGSSPFVNAASGDFTLVGTSNGVGNAFPSQFEGL